MEKPSKPKYGAMKNVLFTLKNIVRIDKMLLVSMAALVFCMVAQPVVGVYMPKFIVHFFEDGKSATELLLLVLAFGVASLLLGFVGFSWWVVAVPTIPATYGVVGSFIVLLIGLYLVNIALLVGAELNARNNRRGIVVELANRYRLIKIKTPAN